MIDAPMAAVDRSLGMMDTLPPRRAQLVRPIFGAEIVGSLVDVEYPDGSGRYICKVTGYLPEFGWHKLESIQTSVDRSLELLSKKQEEAFTDEVDLNSFWRDRRVQFVGSDDDPYTHCPICKWQAAPVASCVTCSDCKTRAHTRCASTGRPGRKGSFIEEEVGSNWVCMHCRSDCGYEDQPPAKRFKLSPAAIPLRRPTPTPSQVSHPSHSETTYAALRGFNEESVSAIVREFFEQVQVPGQARRFRFVTGQEYLARVCGGNINHAVTALQHSATGGVLTWYHGEGEGENLKLLKRALTGDAGVRLVVALLEVSPCSQPKPSLHSKPPTVASCCQLTFGFAVLSGLRSGPVERRELFCQVLVYAARSSHVRSLDELFAVLTERGWSHWSVLDTQDAQLIDYCAEQINECHDLAEYGVESVDPENSGRGFASRFLLDALYLYQGVHTRHAMPPSVKRLTRAGFDPKRFLLVHRGQPMDALTREFIPAPSRLVFGFSMRLLQSLGYRVMLLELALPVAGTIGRRGQGRGVERVVAIKGIRRCRGVGKVGSVAALAAMDALTELEASQETSKAEPAVAVSPSSTACSSPRIGPETTWPGWLPLPDELTLEPTANAAAYKTYRAFGLGEHYAFNRLRVNQHPDYLYPVLGVVLEQRTGLLRQVSLGGVTAETIRQLSVRKAPSLHGISDWISGLQPNGISCLSDLALPPEDREDSQFQRELAVFEQVLDKVSPSHLGAAEGKAKRATPRRSSKSTPGTLATVRSCGSSLWSAVFGCPEDPGHLRRSVRIDRRSR